MTTSGTLDTALISSLSLHDSTVYSTPSLNDCLFLHGMSLNSVSFDFGSIFTNLIQLSLENNAFTEIGNIRNCANLQFLNLRNNLITSIDFDRDLSQLHSLEQINLSSNRIHTFTGPTTEVTSLKHLNLRHNKLTVFPDRIDQFSNLELFDISENSIETMIGETLPKSLRQLYLSPNPFVGKIKFYRNSFISQLPDLVYLDNAFVSECERRSAENPHEGPNTIRREIHEEKRSELEQRITGLRGLQSDQ
jgi:Leucine-rich repeat (LRR) protein